MKQDVENLCRQAVACRECFAGRKLAPAFIDIAQPRWIGPRYWTATQKVLILMTNPGQGAAHLNWAKDVRDQLRGFRDGRVPLRAFFDDQRGAMDFAQFYIHGLKVDLDQIALANVAWCATAENKYRGWMLGRCFERHTKPLITSLRPDVIVMAGRKAQSFDPQIAAAWPAGRRIAMLHHAHRQGRAATARECARVCRVLARDW